MRPPATASSTHLGSLQSAQATFGWPEERTPTFLTGSSRRRHPADPVVSAAIPLTEAAIPALVRASGITHTKPRRNQVPAPNESSHFTVVTSITAASDHNPRPPRATAPVAGYFRKYSAGSTDSTRCTGRPTDAIVGCISRSGPNPIFSAHEGCRVPVCGIFVGRRGNGGDPHSEGPLRLLIEPQAE